MSYAVQFTKIRKRFLHKVKTLIFKEACEFLHHEGTAFYLGLCQWADAAMLRRKVNGRDPCTYYQLVFSQLFQPYCTLIAEWAQLMEKAFDDSLVDIGLKMCSIKAVRADELPRKCGNGATLASFRMCHK